MEIARESGGRNRKRRHRLFRRWEARSSAPSTECRFFRRASPTRFPGCASSSHRAKFCPRIDEIEAFADSSDEKVLLNLSAERLTGTPESIAAALREAVPNVESILIQDRRADKFHLVGPGYLTYAAGGVPYRVGHLSFFQVNRFLIEPLVEAVIGESTRADWRSIYLRAWGCLRWR